MPRKTEEKMIPPAAAESFGFDFGSYPKPPAEAPSEDAAAAFDFGPPPE